MTEQLERPLQGFIFMAPQFMIRQEVNHFHTNLLCLEPVLKRPDIPVPVGINAIYHDKPQIEDGAGVAEAL